MFLAAFPESVQHYVGHAIAPRVVADLFAICLDAEPAALLVGEDDGRIVGYIFTPACLPRVFTTAIRHGHLWRMFIRWISGQYGIGIRPIWVSASNGLAFWHDAHEARLRADARVLSLAVHPAVQGQGVGGELLQRGLAYLDRQGVPTIRLEVRPENAAAIHLYQKYGFRTVGQTRDSQGIWLIMLRRHAEGETA
ncbi:MAG: GNAT family N-acetyltransferase [Acidobacteria bacterium]|nr:GNAT family N-acetyltransferase [Acidobacteriota bacterium]